MNELILVCICAFIFFGFFTLFLRYFTHHPTTSIQQTITSIDGESSRSVSVKGLHPDEIKTLRIITYSSFKELEKIGNECKLECPVCLNEFADDEFIKVLPKCNHAFHEKCIENWLIECGTCPVCRIDLTAESSRHGEEDGDGKCSTSWYYNV